MRGINMNEHKPPFDIDNTMVNLVMMIMENLGKLDNTDGLNRLPNLRHTNRIKSIYSSLAIENNALSIMQVRQVINGKNVIGPMEDITAVKNALKAYETIDNIDPFSIQDLLKVHHLMMNGLVIKSGELRTSQVGVFGDDGKKVHMAPHQNLFHLN